MIGATVGVDAAEEFLREAGDDVFADWWARSRDKVRRAAEATIDEHGSGYTGRTKPTSKDRVYWAIKDAYGVDEPRETHPGGWADQTEILEPYPRAAIILEHVFDGFRLHEEPMADKYFFVMNPKRSYGGTPYLEYEIGNRAFYASFVEGRGYNVVSHLQEPFEEQLIKHGVEGIG